MVWCHNNYKKIERSSESFQTTPSLCQRDFSRIKTSLSQNAPAAITVGIRFDRNFAEIQWIVLVEEKSIILNHSMVAFEKARYIRDLSN